MDRGSEDKVDRISEHLNLDPKDELKFLASEARKVHEIAKEVEFKLTGCKEKGRKEKCKMESMISSLMKENHDISTLLQVAVTEKEAAESSLRELKSDGDQRKSAILQIAEKGLQKVGFGYIMEVISGEPEREDMSSSSSSAASNGRDSEQEVVSLVNSSTSLLTGWYNFIFMKPFAMVLWLTSLDSIHMHLL